MRARGEPDAAVVCDGEGPRLAAKDSVDATVSAIYEVGTDGRVGLVTVSGTTSKPVLEPCGRS